MNDSKQTGDAVAVTTVERRDSRETAVRARKAPASVDAISERVLGAIWEHRLPPGTKLVEEKLASVFGVSRTKIRQALGRLAHDSILTIYPNRGTFVSSPTVEEARQVFNARRVIEPALIRQLAPTATKDQISRLRQNVALESEARARNDRRTIIRLSGEFHIVIAESAGNPFLLKSMRELCSLTCLIIALYDSPGITACPHDEHDDLVDLLQTRDGERASALMVKHLDHVEHALDLHVASGEEIDLEAVFA
jgi:DNA-binding GntR family transcriptional regulator